MLTDLKTLAAIRKRVSLNEASDLAKRSSMWAQAFEDRRVLLGEVERLNTALDAALRRADGLSP